MSIVIDFEDILGRETDIETNWLGVTLVNDKFLESSLGVEDFLGVTVDANIPGKEVV